MDYKEKNPDNISIIRNSKVVFDNFEMSGLFLLAAELNRRNKLDEKRKNNKSLQDVPELSEK